MVLAISSDGSVQRHLTALFEGGALFERCWRSSSSQVTSERMPPGNTGVIAKRTLKRIRKTKVYTYLTDAYNGGIRCREEYAR